MRHEKLTSPQSIAPQEAQKTKGRRPRREETQNNKGDHDSSSSQMGLLSPFPTAWVLLLMPRLHYIHNANQAARTGNRMALQFHLLEMQGSFGSVEANPEGRLGLRLLATTAATHGHFDLVRHLCKEWDVPANAVPPGEEALGFLLRHTLAGVRKGEGLDTPLVQAIQNGQEDMALYLLSLPNQALD